MLGLLFRKGDGGGNRQQIRPSQKNVRRVEICREQITPKKFMMILWRCLPRGYPGICNLLDCIVALGCIMRDVKDMGLLTQILK